MPVRNAAVQCTDTSRSEQDSIKTNPVRFFDDLSNYIPLGSVALSLNYGGKSLPYTNGWIEMDSDRYLSSWADFYDCIMDEEGDPCVPARKLAETPWIRLFARKYNAYDPHAVFRIYVLPDDVGRRHLDRQSLKIIANSRGFLDHLMPKVDISPECWKAEKKISKIVKQYQTEAGDEDSLFYLFNTLPPPTPNLQRISCPISSRSIRSVYEDNSLSGLITQLYPYQKRTVAEMIRREVQPNKALDPRFQSLVGPTGQIFYYDNIARVVLKDKREYEEVRGGILGESMGLGKTLICLATILSTKGHWPMVPIQYTVDTHPVRPNVATLTQMAAAAVTRGQIPWRAVLQESERHGEDHTNCRALLEANVNSYIVPPPESKYSRRKSKASRGKEVARSTATLIIVPQNLLSQWCREIETHVEVDHLDVLYLDMKDDSIIPPLERLLQYDVILLSKPRFEREMVPGLKASTASKSKVAKGGCSCSLDNDCHCSLSDEYQSPLKDIHFLRIIMDEGHEFSASGRTGTAYWALRNVRVDRRWIVSGTPANGLLGVEVEAASDETLGDEANSQQRSVSRILEIRRKEATLLQEQKDLEKLGNLVTGFLEVKPWANSKEDDPASWQAYIMPHSNGQRKAKSLRCLLESLVVRHRIEDIGADIELPPLHNKVVYLQPSYYDKLNINLFILTLAANAVTSERVDQDYMFHPKNRRYLNVLVNNLRHAGFYWTSIGVQEVSKTIEVSRAYLGNHMDCDTDNRGSDRKLLEEAIRFGELVLESPSWKALTESNEMGVFVEDFPDLARSAWSLVHEPGDGQLLVGATVILSAQAWVDQNLYAPDPSLGFAEFGTDTMQKMWRQVQGETVQGSADSTIIAQSSPSKSSPRPKLGSDGVPKLTQRRTMSRARTVPGVHKRQQIDELQRSQALAKTGCAPKVEPPLKSALKSSAKREPEDLLPPDSPLAKSKIYGTASAKLSYLMDQVALLHKQEKILIFYEGDAIAWYIAQALDLIDIRYLIYTKTLPLSRQTAYIQTFNTTETFRVLLMNVHQAAHGLHIASASRVFFVEPLWQPGVEAQAIKRAHRIGQHRPVFIETLVLKDTLEDQMLQRRKGMTAQEHQKAEQSLLDDDIMSTIIQNARFIPLLEEETNNVDRQVARLRVPQQLFARPGKAEGHANDPDSELIFPLASTSTKRRKKKQTSINTKSAPTIPASYNHSQPSTRTYLDGNNTQQEEPSIPNSINGSHRTLSAPAWSTPSTSAPAQGEGANSPPNNQKINEGRRRVGFALDVDQIEPPSLFGGGSKSVSFAAA